MFKKVSSDIGINLADLKAYLKVADTGRDTELQYCLNKAVDYFESASGISLSNSTYKYFASEPIYSADLICPISSITSVLGFYSQSEIPYSANLNAGVVKLEYAAPVEITFSTSYNPIDVDIYSINVFEYAQILFDGITDIPTIQAVTSKFKKIC